MLSTGMGQTIRKYDISTAVYLHVAKRHLQNPRNWSRGKKIFVTFEICFLTFSVYIGSAIYTPGLLDVVQVFGVSQVAAVLGLCLYVAGYGLGPLIWSPMSEVPQIGRLWVYIGTLCK
jgi:DHA1 family multidrug resistance protein-like MFS transporter